MTSYKKSILSVFLVIFMVALLLSGCGAQTPEVEENAGSTDEPGTTSPSSIETDILGKWQLAAVLVHGGFRQEYVSETYLTFLSDGTVELSDINFEEPLIYSGTYYAEDGKVYTDYTSVNQESYEVSPENMNGIITIDGDTGELVYDYVHDSNGLTWYFVAITVQS